MTVLVGIPHNGVTWIGADSATNTGPFVRTTCESKVWRQGEFVFAGTGSVRESQLVTYRVTLPALVEGADVLRYLVVDFADAVRQARKDGGYDEKEPRGQEAGPVLMIGYAGRLFLMYSDYAIEEHVDFAVHGCGREFAHGSLHTTSAAGWKGPKRRIEAALAAACSASPYCQPPFTILRTS